MQLPDGIDRRDIDPNVAVQDAFSRVCALLDEGRQIASADQLDTDRLRGQADRLGGILSDLVDGLEEIICARCSALPLPANEIRRRARAMVQPYRMRGLAMVAKFRADLTRGTALTDAVTKDLLGEFEAIFAVDSSRAEAARP